MAIKEVEYAIKGDDKSKIENTTKTLMTVAQNFVEAMNERNQKEQASNQQEYTPPEQSDQGRDNVIDAEFSEVK